MPKPVPKPWFVYMLRCSKGCLYTGITTDVQRRLPHPPIIGPLAPVPAMGMAQFQFFAL